MFRLGRADVLGSLRPGLKQFPRTFVLLLPPTHMHAHASTSCTCQINSPSAASKPTGATAQYIPPCWVQSVSFCQRWNRSFTHSLIHLSICVLMYAATRWNASTWRAWPWPVNHAGSRMQQGCGDEGTGSATVVHGAASRGGILGDSCPWGLKNKPGHPIENQGGFWKLPESEHKGSVLSEVGCFPGAAGEHRRQKSRAGLWPRGQDTGGVVLLDGWPPQAWQHLLSSFWSSHKKVICCIASGVAPRVVPI